MCSEHVEKKGPVSDETESLHELHTAYTSVTQESIANKSGTGSSKKRKSDDSLIKFGFMSTGDRNSPDGQCVECNRVLANSSLNPGKLRSHFETKLSQLLNKHMIVSMKKKKIR